ncbi:MAG: serine/threonine-protein kinase [Acidobacteriota bacterium]
MSLLANLIGQVLDGKYHLEEQLGQGGMGAVFLAIHLGTQRPVALKVIAPQFMTQPEFLERFKREAEAAGRLRHPNVVNVTDFGCAQVGEERFAYLVMEHLDGVSLAEVLEDEKQLSLGWVVDIMEQVCSAIDEAHQHGIVHRDLKPDNIWLEPNRRGGYTIKVLDFGLAKLGEIPPPRSSVEPAIKIPEQCIIEKLFTKAEASESASQPSLHHLSSPTLTPIPTTAPSLESPALSAITAIQTPLAEIEETATQVQSTTDDEETQVLIERNTAANNDDPRTSPQGLTRVGSILGTPLYMSPEQCRGEALDARSDIYSLGVITYQMLAGETPFKGDTYSLMAQHNETPAPSLRKHRRDIPKSVARLVMLALAKDANCRPATAAAFASALRADSEGAGTLLRQAVALYSEHFPTFLRLSLFNHLIEIVFGLLLTVTIALRTYGVLPKIQLITIVIGLLFALGCTISPFINAAAFVPAVVHILLLPLRPLQLKGIFVTLKKQLRPLVVTIFYSFLTVSLRFLLLFIPGLIAYIDYSLSMPVVIMEGYCGRTALARSKLLVRRSLRTVIAISVVQILLPVTGFFLHKVIMGQIITWLKLADSATAKVAGTAVHIGLTTFLHVLLNPLLAIMVAMLYFKTRQAGGETLKEALGKQLEAETVASRWQLRMRERSRARSRLASNFSH